MGSLLILTRYFVVNIIILIVILLICAGCNYYRSENEIIDATYEGNINTIKRLIEKNPKLVDAQFTDPPFEGALSLLHIALAKDHQDVALFLIEKGANVNVMNGEAQTPLHYAAMRNYNTIAKALLDHGAKINIKDSSGHTPLDIANLNKNKKMIKLLSSAKNRKY